jgi:hypothetical protein
LFNWSYTFTTGFTTNVGVTKLSATLFELNTALPLPPSCNCAELLSEALLDTDWLNEHTVVADAGRVKKPLAFNATGEHVSDVDTPLLNVSFKAPTNERDGCGLVTVTAPATKKADRLEESLTVMVY